MLGGGGANIHGAERAGGRNDWHPAPFNSHYFKYLVNKYFISFMWFNCTCIVLNYVSLV